MTHESYNEFHLGDNLIHLHFLRKLSRRYDRLQFVHAVHPCHFPQLQEAVEDLWNVKLIPLEHKSPGAMNVWKNAGATMTDGSHPTPAYVPGYWEQHPERNNYGRFYVAWFHHLAAKMGLESPIRNPQDLWFDYPKAAFRSERVCRLLSEVSGEPVDAAMAEESSRPRFDFLVVNSQPCSGQFRAYNEVEYLTPLIHELAAKYKVVCTQPIQSTVHSPQSTVICTQDYQLTISEVGALSLHADHLVMVSTGPSWPTFNVWNVETVKLRLLMLDTEVIDYMPGMVQVNNRESARQALVQRGLI